AWEVPSDFPRLYRPETGPQDRIFVRAGDSLECLRLSARRELIWKTYIGTDNMSIEDNSHVLAVQSGQKLLVIDRSTGQLLANITLPDVADKRRRKAKSGPFSELTMDEDRILACGGKTIFAWDARTGAEVWRHDLERFPRLLSLEARN